MPFSEKKTGGGPGKVKEVPGAPPSGKPVETLPCPRCESMNTKFCYYNNYSVTQPRHFCRQCQRYWTAGGTLRNVPVGGGSRKKNRSSYPRIEPYGLQHRMVGGYAGVMPSPGVFQPGFQQQLMTPDMAAFGLPHGHAQMAMYPPGLMYGTAGGTSVGPLPLQMARPAGLTFDMNLANGQNANSSQENTPPKTSQGLLDLSPSLNPIVGGSGAEAAAPVSKTTASPPHGSSTIEEEGSTPTNGYSNNGYEEGEAVSSMWHEMHDMDNVLFQ